jgi:competence protein CoiA
LKVASYHFDASLKAIPKTSWYSKDGKKMTAGGYTRRSKRYRRAIRGGTFDLATDFSPKERLWWEGGGMKVPDARLFMQSVEVTSN